MPKDDDNDGKKPDAVALAPLLAGQRLLGVVKNYNGSTGFGFVTCAETHQLFKRDVFLQRQEVISSGAKVGSTVSFTVELNKDGKPQARHVEVLSPEDDELKPPGQASTKDGPLGVFYEMMSSVDDYVEGVLCEMQRFEGYIKSFHKEHGFGFVACVDTHRIFGRDVFLHQSNLSGCWVGDAITFRLDIDPLKGTPRAKEVTKAPFGTLERIQSGDLSTIDVILAAIGMAAIQMSIMSLNGMGTAGASDMLGSPGAPNIPSVPALPLAGGPCAPNIPSAPVLPLAGRPCAPNITGAPTLPLAGTPGVLSTMPAIPCSPAVISGLPTLQGMPTTVDTTTPGFVFPGMTIPPSPGSSSMVLSQTFASVPAMSDISMQSPQSFSVVAANGVSTASLPGMLGGSNNFCQMPGMFASLPAMTAPPPPAPLNVPGIVGVGNPWFSTNGLSSMNGSSNMHLQSMPVAVAQNDTGKETPSAHSMGDLMSTATGSTSNVVAGAFVESVGPLAAGMGGMDLQGMAKLMSAMGVKNVKIPSMEKIQAYLEKQERQDAAVKMQIEQLQQLAQKGEEKPERRAAAGGMPQAPPPEFDTKQRFVGIINKFNRARGFGFIKCDETYAAYGDDVFLHNEQRDGFEVGDVVSFALEIRGTQARARDLRAASSKNDKGYDKESEPSSLDRWGAMKNRTRFDRISLHDDREKKDSDRSPARDRSRSRGRDRKKDKRSRSKKR